MEQGKQVLIQSNLLKRAGRWLAVHLAQGINCFIIGAEPLDRAVFERVRSGSLLARYGVGYDNPGQLQPWREHILQLSPNHLLGTLVYNTCRSWLQ
jgi:hypothetical protein